MEYCPRIQYVAAQRKSQKLLYRLGEAPEIFTGRVIFMSMFNDISCGSKDNEKGCLANAKLVSLNARRIGKGQWSLKGGTNFPRYEPIVQRSTQKQGHGKLSIHYAADLETVETILRIFVSANQLSLHGAVAEICEEYEFLHERTERPVVMGQSSSSLVLNVIKTEVPLDCDDPVNQDLLLQQYEERIEKLSQQDKLSKFCMDAGFLNVVEIGQYFRTKDTADLSQFHAVVCREYSSKRRRSITTKRMDTRETPKLGPYWKLQPVTCTVSMELRSQFGL